MNHYIGDVLRYKYKDQYPQNSEFIHIIRGKIERTYTNNIILFLMYVDEYEPRIKCLFHNKIYYKTTGVYP